MTKKYDLVIIGAGPAGLTAAITAKQEGLNVLLIDQKKKIARIRRTCAEGLITRPNCDGETVTVEGEKIIFHINDFSISYHGPWIDMKQYIYISPNGSKIIIQRDETPVAKIFNKEVLLEELLSEVENSGCEIQNETMGIKAENTKGEVIVTIQSNGKHKQIRSKIAIAADGVNSRIVEGLGLNKKRKFFSSPKLVSYFLGNVKTSFPNAFINFKGRGHSDGQLGYFMPKAPRKEGNPPLFEIVGTTEATLNSFLSKGIYSSWFKESTVVQKRSAVLNFYTPILEPVIGNVMIVGDAASFIEVYVQGAIMYGFRAAKAAAKELTGDSGFAEYVDYWKTSYEYNRPEMMEEACKLALGLQTLEDKELDYLFALQEPQIIKSYYDEFASNLVISAIMNHVPRIKREQPLLAKKIDALFKAPIEEVLGKGIKRYLE